MKDSATCAKRLLRCDRFFPFALFVLILLASLSQATPSSPKIATQSTDSFTWIDLSGLANSLNLPTHWDPSIRRLQLGTGENSVSWSIGIPWAGTPQGAKPLEGTPRLSQGTWWVPLGSSLQILGEHLGSTLVWNSKSQQVTRRFRTDLTSMRIISKGETDLLEIALARKVAYESTFHPPNLILRLNDAHADTNLTSALKASRYIKHVTMSQDSQSVQIQMQLTQAVDAAEVVELDSGRTLKVQVQNSNNPVEEEATIPTPRQPQRKLRTVVIDPGHGGKDPGALGKDLMEKDVVLTVGRKIRDRLRRAGFIVRMTREDDSFVELQDRPSLASKWKGDLFISLHCNAVDGEERKKKTDGFHVYILREAESEEDKAIARRENKAAELSAKKTKSEITPLEWILLENQLNAFTKESERFAEFLINDYDGGSIRKMGSGAGQAGFMVLVGAFMPAVLVELGFITHPDDSHYMASERGQDDMADRITKGVIQFRDSEE